MGKFYYSGLLVTNLTNPVHKNRAENLKGSQTKQRVYKWNASNKRKVRSRASYLAYIGKPCYFITLTFPLEIDNNKVMKLFIDNLKHRNYVEDYIWVKERGSKNGRLHYHLLFNSDLALFGSDKKTRPVSFVADKDVFQDAWNSALVGMGGRGSNNSVRLGRSPVVRKISRVGSYIIKYVTKELGEFQSRMFGCSYGLKECEVLINNDKKNTLGFSPYRIDVNDYVKNEYFSLSLPLIKRVQELAELHSTFVPRSTASEALEVYESSD